MGKIYRVYSRKRLNFGFLNNAKNKKKRYYYFNSKKIKRLISLLIIIITAITVCNIIWRAITPIFEALSRDEAKNMVIVVTNEETSKVMNKYNYDTFFTLEKDTNGDIKMISANVLKVNQINSEIALNIQKSLRKNNEKKIGIPVGSLTGMRLFAGSGPKIYVKIIFTRKCRNKLIKRVYS